MIDRARFVRIFVAAAGLTVALAPSAWANQYCHNEWSAEKGDHQVCENYPDPRYQTKCHWTWDNRQVCEQTN